MATLTADRRPLPAGWRWMRLGELIAEAQPGFACGDRDPSGVVQLRMNNVDTRGNLVWDDFIRVPADPGTLTKYSLVDGDVVFNNTNSTALVGKTALFRGHVEPVVYSNHFTRLRVRADRLDPGYLASWLLLQWQSRVFEELCNRWIGQSAVKNDKLLALEIPLAPLPEQRRIAAILNEQMAAVERARAAAEAQLAAARALLAAYLREVFESQEAKQWPEKSLGAACEITMGQSPEGISYNSDGQGAPLLNGPTEFGPVHPTPAQWTTSPTRFAQPGDILLCVRGATTGRKNYADRQYCIGRGLAAIRGRPGVATTGFVWFALDVATRRLLDQTAGSTFPNLPGEKLEATEVHLPDVSRQKRIVDKLTAVMNKIDQTKKALQTQLAAINGLPAALLRQAFNGEL